MYEICISIVSSEGYLPEVSLNHPQKLQLAMKTAMPDLGCVRIAMTLNELRDYWTGLFREYFFHGKEKYGLVFKICKSYIQMKFLDLLVMSVPYMCIRSCTLF